MKPFSTLAVLLSLSVTPDYLFADDFHLTGTLVGRQEVPPISTLAKGTFKGIIGKNLTELAYDLEYSRLGPNVTQVHIHFGQEGVNGGIMAFLCSNLPDRFVQSCPNSGHIFGIIRASDIYTGAESQGIGPGNFFAFQRAIRQGVAYVDVHSTTFPTGEIRGQIRVERLLDDRLAQDLDTAFRALFCERFRSFGQTFGDSTGPIPRICQQNPGVLKAINCRGDAPVDCTGEDESDCRFIAEKCERGGSADLGGRTRCWGEHCRIQAPGM